MLKPYLVIVLFALSTTISNPVFSQPASAIQRGQDLIDRMAEPIFEAAEIAPELRFKIKLVRGSRPVALMVTKEAAEVSTATLEMADHPEDVAAAIARIIADARSEPAVQPAKKRFTIKGQVPTQSSLRGGITSTDEAIARSSELAAEETLQQRGNYGPPVEQIRARARQLDSFAIEVLRKADLTAAPLLHLYENMARAGEGLFERPDYEGRRILGEQVNWLRERTRQEDEKPVRPEFWKSLDAELHALKLDLQG